MRFASAPLWTVHGGRQLTPAPFLIAGIVNVTPDSFSDGGRYDGADTAAARVEQMAAEGAHMVDIGGESTRPGAVAVGHEEEFRRIAPTVRLAVALAAKGRGPAVSVDTFRARTAAAVLSMGADIINDVSGGLFEPDMAQVVAEHRPGYVLGHSPARPDAMASRAVYDDVVETLVRHFSERMDLLVRAGLPETNICLDPCIGFGKNLEHTAAILEGLPRLAALGRPLYFGVSRKSFIAEATGRTVAERNTLTQVAVGLLASRGVQIHRVHDVAATRDTLLLTAALLGTKI